jgi:uncharacterized integral membrane protein
MADQGAPSAPGTPPQVVSKAIELPGEGITDKEIVLARIRDTTKLYSYVVWILGIIIILVIIVAAFITVKNIGLPADVQAQPIPEGLIAIGSAAVGALAGLLAPSPASKD